ncbi:MAG: phenylalanine--tRNA ligase subunit alpha, partial [Ilumatobacteraceae bacterium]
MIEDLHVARDAALADVAAASSLDELAALDARLLGKKGELAGFKRQLGSLGSVDEKKAAGAAVNEALAAVAAALDERRAELAAAARSAAGG